jgi:Peptidase family S41
VRRSSLVVAVASSLLGCAGAPPPPCPPAAAAPVTVASPAADPKAFPSADERLALFKGLVDDIHKYHVFAAATSKLLGFTFDDDLPALEKEFVAANDSSHLDVALDHLVNDLHNPHCIFESTFPQDYFETGVTFNAEWRGGVVHFYVSIVPASLAGRLNLGDELVSVDDIAAADVLRRYSNRSRQNNWHAIANEVAGSIGGPYPLRLNLGTRSHFVVQKRGTREEVAFDLTWKKTDFGAALSGDEAIDYAKPSCSVLRDADYGGYELVTRGHNLCVYAARSPERRGYPIVRHFSYSYAGSGYQRQYAPHQVRADHELLVRELDRLKPKGVILDLRDNAGGNNTHWFMDWYAHGAYADDMYRMRLHADFDSEQKVKEAGIPHAKWYLQQLRGRTPGQTLSALHPFNCDGSDCVRENHLTPSHQVTTAPIALLVGMGCASSCDAFVRWFGKYHFGPVIGEPTAAGLTFWRLRREVILPNGQKFGAYRVAFTEDFDNVSNEGIEGVPVHLDVEIDRTFENKKGYDKLLVEAAVKALQTKPAR